MKAGTVGIFCQFLPNAVRNIAIFCLNFWLFFTNKPAH